MHVSVAGRAKQGSREPCRRSQRPRPVLPAQIAERVEYWLVTRSEALRRSAGAATVVELKASASAAFPETTSAD